MERKVYKVSELKALKATCCSSELSEDEKQNNNTTWTALLASKLSIKIICDQPSSNAFQNRNTCNKPEITTLTRSTGNSLHNQNNKQSTLTHTNNNNSNNNNNNNNININQKYTTNNCSTPNNGSNSNYINSSSSYVSASGNKKLSIAQQRLLFEKEREEILKGRENKVTPLEIGGEPTIRKYHDESDEIMMEFQKEARKVDKMYEEEEMKLSGSAFPNSMNKMQTSAGFQSSNPPTNEGIDTWLADIFNKPITGDGFFFDMTNATKDTESPMLFQFENQEGSSNVTSFSGSHSKQSRLGSILGINSITLSPEKTSTKSSRNFVRDDDDDNTLEVVNSALDSALRLNGLLSDISPMGGGNVMIPPFDMPLNTKANLSSVFLSVQNDSYLAQTAISEVVTKSTDVLTKLGFNRPEQVDDMSTHTCKSSFSFQDSTSSASKKKAKTPVISAASRLQLNKMKSVTKTVSVTNSSTPKNELLSSETKSNSAQYVQSVESKSPLTSQIKSEKGSPFSLKPVEETKSPMQRLNINALFEAAAISGSK